MIVKNPTDKEITVSIKGCAYTVGANSDISGVPAEHAEYWKTMLHNFLTVEAEGSAKPVKVEKKVEMVVEEISIKEEKKEPTNKKANKK